MPRRVEGRELRRPTRRQLMPHAGVCSPSASNVLSRPAVLRATSQTEERGVEGGLGWKWLQVETPLARTDVERRPQIQETTQRPRCQALLGATLESGGGSQGLYAPALHSEAAMLWVQGGTAILKPNTEGGSCSLSFSQGSLLPLKAAQTGTSTSGSWLLSKLVSQH